MWACAAAGRWRVSGRCTRMHLAARWPQRETCRPGGAGWWCLRWDPAATGTGALASTADDVAFVCLAMSAPLWCHMFQSGNRFFFHFRLHKYVNVNMWTHPLLPKKRFLNIPVNQEWFTCLMIFHLTFCGCSTWISSLVCFLGSRSTFERPEETRKCSCIMQRRDASSTTG